MRLNHVKRKSARQLLNKVQSAQWLFRHSINGTYYAQKKINGKRKEHSLDTTDRKIAERRLKEWIANLEAIDSEAETMTLAELLENSKKLEAVRTQQLAV
jgi:hypothetical protein